MCGISGVWGEVSRESIQAMVAAVDHRDPDHRGRYFGLALCWG